VKLTKQLSRCVLLALVAFAGPLSATTEKTQPYTFTIVAEQTNNVVTAIASVHEAMPGGELRLIAKPRITMLDGQRATMSVGAMRFESVAIPPGEPNLPASGKGDQAGDDELYSGVRIEVIKPLAKDLLAVAMIVDKGSIVWAETVTVKIANKPAPASQASEK
jgi:hypothetical protein